MRQKAEQREQQILEFIKDHPGERITQSKVAEYIGVSQQRVGILMIEMSRRGDLKRDRKLGWILAELKGTYQ